MKLSLRSKFSRSNSPSTGIAVTRNAYFVLLSLVLLTLSSCVRTADSPPASPTLNPAAQSILPTNTLPAPTATIAPTPTQLTVTNRSHVVCSPLAIQPLHKFRSIVTQPFIMPRIMDDGSYKDSGHHGLDVGFIVRDNITFTGTPVLSALEGKIASVIQDRPPYGDMIMVETAYEKIPPKLIKLHDIQPGQSLYTLYGHLQNMQTLKIGDTVKCGQLLAEAGLTGTTGGPHLHFETRWGPAGAIFPRMGFYLGGVTPEEMEYYTLWRMSGKFKLFDPFDLIDS